jgi:hypothetical protein
MGIAALILEAIVVALSLAAGRGLIGGPETVRIALAFFALFVIPGASLERLIFRTGGSVLERACRIFILGLVFVSGVVCGGFIPGVSYGAISVVASVLALVLLPCGHLARARRTCPAAPDRSASERDTSSRPPRARSWIMFALLFVLSFLIFSGTGELAWHTDSLDHVSFIRRSLDSGVLFPRDSFYREGDGVSLDPRKGLWHPVLSLWTYQSHAPADRVWRALPGFVACFAMSSFLLLALELSGSTLCTIVSLGLFLLFYGGEGFGWLTKLGLSRNIVQVTLWADLAFLISYYRSGNAGYLFVTFLASCMGAAFHVAFALLAGTVLLGLSLYVTCFPGGRGWRAAFWRSVPVQLAGVALPLAVRASAAFAPANVIHTHVQGMLIFARHLAIVDPAEIATRYGLVFFYAVGLAPFFFLAARRSERRGLVFMLFIVPVCIVFDPLLAAAMEERIGYLHYRILDAAPVLVILALVVAGLFEILLTGGTASRMARDGVRSRGPVRGALNRVLAAGCIAVLILYPVRSSVPRLEKSARGCLGKQEEPTREYAALFEALGKRIPGRSVIASDPLTSYVLSAYTDHFVTVTLDQHGSPVDTNAMDRLREARNLMSPVCAISASSAWLAREGVDYVLLNMDPPVHGDFFNSFVPGASGAEYEKLRACPSVLTEVLAVGSFRLFGVRRDALESVQPGGCGAARAASVPCGGDGAGRVDDEEWQKLVVGTGMDVGSGFVLESLTVDNYMLGPGDTLRGHFCWRASGDVPFGLPIELAVRIDTSFPKGRLYREWYGKQYRRIIERRNGRFWRLTWQSRLMSGWAYPDMWGTRGAVRQDFSLPLSRALAPGAYELRVKVRRVPYLPNRYVRDYLSNDDSLQGAPVGMIYIQGHFSDKAISTSGGLLYARRGR